MLIACEVTVELYMGLAASPQMQVGVQEVEEEGALLWIETEALPLGGALGVGVGVAAWGTLHACPLCTATSLLSACF